MTLGRLGLAVVFVKRRIEGYPQVLETIFRSFVVASALALSAGSVQAVTVSYQGNSAFNGHGNAAVKIHSTVSQPVNALAGGFFLKGDIDENGVVQDFVGWCLDIVHRLAPVAEYNPTTTPFEGDVLTDKQISYIRKLFNTALFGLDFSKDSSDSAGFQLALWEIIYENENNKFNLTLGDLRISGKYADKAIQAGQAFLDNLGGTETRRWNLTFLESKLNQDLVTATPVPVPAAAGLLLLALGGLAAAGRRRRTV